MHVHMYVYMYVYACVHIMYVCVHAHTRINTLKDKGKITLRTLWIKH